MYRINGELESTLNLQMTNLEVSSSDSAYSMTFSQGLLNLVTS